MYFWRRDIQLCKSRIKQFWWHRVETLCHANLVVTFKSFLSHHNPLLNPSYGFEHRSNNESFTLPSFITDNKSWFHREHFWFQWISLRLWNVEKSWLCFNFFFFNSGQPYAGSAQKMGSAPLKRYTPTNIRGNGCIVNKAVSYCY